MSESMTRQEMAEMLTRDWTAQGYSGRSAQDLASVVLAGIECVVTSGPHHAKHDRHKADAEDALAQLVALIRRLIAHADKRCSCHGAHALMDLSNELCLTCGSYQREWRLIVGELPVACGAEWHEGVS